MASDGNRKNRKFFEPKIPHFFKIILQQSVDQGRLEIPRKFVMKYGKDLSNRISLQVPSGTIWKVDLEKSNDGVYMQNGWREFQQYYSIAHGTFLSFEYRSRNFFQVIVYDFSATEIVYPYNDDEDERKEAACDRENRADVIVQDDCLLSSFKRRKNSPLPCPRPPKVGRTSDASGSATKSKLHTSTSDEECDKVSSVAAKSRKLKNLGRNTSRPNKSRTFKESAGFKLENPSFSVIMKPAYACGNYVNININFARKYMKNCCNVTLQNLERKNWTVGYVIYNEHNLARLASGWSAFVRGNNLLIGTKCVFELIDPAKFVLKVHTIRHSRSSGKSEKLTDSTHPCSPELQSEDPWKERGKQQLSSNKRKLSNKNVRKKVIADGKNDALSRAVPACQPENLSFRVVIQPTYTGVRLVVPFLFAKRHFKKNDCAIVLQNVDGDGKTWNVYCRINSKNRRAYFQSNWAAFVRDNNLKIGDVCIFEQTKNAELVLKVIIERAGDSHASVGSMHGSKSQAVEKDVLVDSKIDFGLTPASNGVEVTDPDRKSACRQNGENSDRQLSEGLPSSWIHEIVEAAEKFNSIHPCFKATIKLHDLQRSVPVPAKFAKIIKLGPDNASILKLQVGKRRWPVKFGHSPKHKTWKLTSGWAEFSEENSLKVGEICAFELVERESLQVKVTIFRHKA